MEHCTIYSHKIEFEKVIQIVKSNLPKAKIEFNDGGLQKSLIATIKGGLFSNSTTLKINYRQRENPSYKLEKVECDLTQNLAGMMNFIQSIPAKNEEVRNRFAYKVMSANCEMPFMAEPEINSKFESILKTIIAELDAYIFTQPSKFFNKSTNQHFVDKNFNLILDTEGNCEINDIEVNADAKYHDQPAIEYLPEQLERKERSENYLNEKGLKVNKNLPCIPCSKETKVRETNEIIDRIYALMIIAAKGEGIEQAQLTRTIKDKNITSFSPKESIIYKTEKLSDQEKAYATWRYESLYVMLWSLGIMDELKYPNEICNVAGMVSAILKPTREEFNGLIKLRDASEVLDKLDKIFRMNWACVDAKIKGHQVSGNINPSIVYERHYSLNWLTNYQNHDWDDIQTNT